MISVTTKDWSGFKPLPINESMAFAPSSAELKKLAPMLTGYKAVEVSEAVKDRNNFWRVLVSHIFFVGLKKGFRFTPKAGIDPEMALKHFRTVLGSWEPSHNEKEAVCAFLLSLWFDDFKPAKDDTRLIEELKRAKK